MQSSSTKHEHGDFGKSAQPTLLTPKGDGYRAERTFWIVMLALPLLAYCVVAVQSFSIKPVPITTGDALYDRYLTWVADGLDSNTAFGNRTQRLDPHLGWDPFADWEAEFGNDPRYWMLRYRYAESEITKTWQYRKNVIGHLEKARELGMADGAVLLVLLTQIDDEIWNESRQWAPTGKSRSSNFDELQKFLRGQVDEQIGAEHDKLLAELLEAAGNESLPHYYAAMFDSQRGDYAAAIAHLADGNRAPDNTTLVGFPFQRHMTDLLAGNPLPDDLIGGSILMDWYNLPMPNFIETKQMLKALVAEAVSREDRAGLDEIHTFACRFGRAEGSTLITSLVALVMIQIVETEYSNSVSGSLSPAQASKLLQLTNMRGKVKSHFTMTGTSMPYYNPLSMPLAQKSLWFIEGGLSGGRTTTAEYFQKYHDYYVNQNSSLNQGFQLFEQLEAFNYNTLEFE